MQVKSDTIINILEAGRMAHSSKNSQPCRFIVIRSRETLRKISKTTPTGEHIAKAAFAVALFTEGAKLPEVDGARTMEDMMIYAWSVGVGSCWVTNFDEETVRHLLDAPKSWKLITVVPFGYPSDGRRKGWKRRRPLSEVAYLEKFGNPVSELR